VRNRRGLNKIGILAMALLIALGAIGTAYGAWVDEIYIEGTLSTGDINASLNCGNSYFEGETTDLTGIKCMKTASWTLNYQVANALEGLDYYCLFNVNNDAGSLPIKIKSLNLTGSYSGVTAAIENMAVGDVIDPGNSATGKVHIYLTNDTSTGEDLTYTLTVSVERWNE
jgi:hypothetical protein